MLPSEKIVLIEIIKMYKKMNLLWNKKHPDYKNRILRKQAYIKLLRKYKEIDDEATIPVIKRKLLILRNNYIRELKKVRCSSKKGEVHTPVLWYYQLLSFLENQVETSSVALAYNASPDSNDDDGNHSSQSSHSNVDYNDLLSGQMKVEYLEDSSENVSDSSEEYNIKPATLFYKGDSDSEPPLCKKWELIGKALAIQLRDIEPIQAAIAQKLISDTLFYAKLGSLTESAEVCPNRSDS